jgi:hypothetical protein
MARKPRKLPPNRAEVELHILGDVNITVPLGTIENDGSPLDEIPGLLRAAADDMERTRAEASEG